MILSLVLAATLDLRLELVRESLTGTHCRYREYVNGIPNESYVMRPCATGSAPPPAQVPRYARDDKGRIRRREIIEESPFRPFAYDYDATTGALIRRIPLFFDAKPARVFDPNPVAALNDPTLQDQDDRLTAVPVSAYKDVELQDVAASGPLRGPYVALVDRQAPNIPPPDSAGSLVYGRDESGFEDVSAYFHIDRTQRQLQAYGYTGSRAIAPYAVETDAHAGNGLDNSFFLPSASQPGIGTLFFGEGGTDDAEDADLVVHEYGHALLEWISPGTFAGTFASQARAFSEGFGDYLSFSSHYAQRTASGRDPFCFADWDTRCWTDSPSEQCAYPPGSDCLRRLDSPRTMADYETTESSGVEHRNGQIFSSALREIFLVHGKQITDTILIESTFGAPPLPSFAVMARRILDADQLLYGGAHATAICSAMVSRGILGSGDCGITPRGEWTHFQSGDRGIAIPEADPAGIVSRLTITDAREIERLFVRVDIEHPSRGDLRIELIAPDGTIVLLQQIAAERASDVHVTFGIDATTAQSLDVFRGRSAAGVWQLRVADLRFRDVGRLLSWGLVIQFAGDAPLAERPRHARAQMIPAIGHRYGQFDTFFASDLRIANVRSTTETATLIFTRDGEDGRANFSAVKVAIDAGRTMVFDDVLQSVYHTSGSGTLEILGDVVAWSRTYFAPESGGTLGDSVPPNVASTVRNNEGLFLTAYLEAGSRTNVSVTETAGLPGTIAIVGHSQTITLPIAPFSRVQVPLLLPRFVSVTGGDARVAAVLSQIDNKSGDATIVPAVQPGSHSQTLIAPATDMGDWHSQVWLSSASGTWTTTLAFLDAVRGDVVAAPILGSEVGVVAYDRALPTIFLRSNTFGAFLGAFEPRALPWARIKNGDTAQYTPFVRPEGPMEQHLVFVENNAAYRTNIGILSAGNATAEVIVYDGAGVEIDRQTLSTPRGLARTAVRPPVTGGRAVVRFLAGTGRALASLIDNVTGDAALILGQ